MKVDEELGGWNENGKNEQNVLIHKEKCIHFLKVVIILINFLHSHHLEFTYEVIGDQIEDQIDYDWDGDFKLQV